MYNDLITLAYVSRNTIGENGADMDREIGQMLASARRKNPLQGVTGALLFSDNCFAQVLEGPPEAVDAAYHLISADPRHRDVILLHRDGLEQRYFTDWSMAFAAVEPHSQEGLDLDRELTTQAAAYDPTYGRELALMLYDLIRRRAQEAGDLTWASFDFE